MIAAHVLGRPEIGDLIVAVGATLLLGFGLEDHGKAKAAIEADGDE